VRATFWSTKPTCPKKARSKRAMSFSNAPRISSCTNGWQRIAPCPKMIIERVRMFAPSTVMPIGSAA